MYKLQHLPGNYTLSSCVHLFENFTGDLIIGLMFSFLFIPVLMEMQWWRGAAPRSVLQLLALIKTQLCDLVTILCDHD